MSQAEGSIWVVVKGNHAYSKAIQFSCDMDYVVNWNCHMGNVKLYKFAECMLVNFFGILLEINMQAFELIIKIIGMEWLLICIILPDQGWLLLKSLVNKFLKFHFQILVKCLWGVKFQNFLVQFKYMR